MVINYELDYNTLYIIGILFTLIIGIANFILTLKNTKKTVFTNSITTSRIKYIQDIRNYIAEFCGTIYSYYLRESEFDDQELFELHKQADKIKYLIKLHLNPEDKYWDKSIMSLLQEILDLSDKNPTLKIDELITITQYLLKLEWEGAKLESEKGILSKQEKHLLYEKYKKLHIEFLESNKKE
jgi:hypothetical protein